MSKNTTTDLSNGRCGGVSAHGGSAGGASAHGGSTCTGQRGSRTVDTAAGPLRLVPFGAEHIDRALELEALCFTDPWGRASLELLCRPEVAAFACVTPEGRPVSYGGAFCVAGDGEIIDLATDPEYRRMGCAAAVLDAVLDELAARGATIVSLEVRRSNAAAASLYMSRGFRPVGIRKGYYRLPAEDAVVMRKTIGGNDVPQC
jgi:ribosomal-protein-alanine N-acetyltransferase